MELYFSITISCIQFVFLALTLNVLKGLFNSILHFLAYGDPDAVKRNWGIKLGVNGLLERLKKFLLSQGYVGKITASALKRTFLLLLCFSFDGMIMATRWPLIRVANTHKTVFSSSKNKHRMSSCAKIKKTIALERVQNLFSDSLSLATDQTQDTLQDVFLNARKQRSTKVLVLLARADKAIETEWRLSCPQGFLVHVQDNNGIIKKIIKMPALIIKIKRGVLLCNGKRVTGSLQIRSIGGYGECNGIVYDGDFLIVPDKNSFLCINNVELEDYVTAVLRTESWPGWPLEVNKVFAIACRSYVMFKILEAQRTGRLYHVKNTNAHQTYCGKHQQSVLKMAVAQTRSIVLGFKGSPILAMFDCCCGGVVPAHIEDFDFKKAPYLARTYACNFCKQSSLYSWQVSYDLPFFESLVQCYVPEMVRLSDIHVIKKDKAGLATQVKLKGSHHTTTIAGKKLYSLLKDVKSFHFDVHKKSGKIVFSGRGFGHHLGLCQWGARNMVRQGWDYKSILRFYYPGAYFMHLI